MRRHQGERGGLHPGAERKHAQLDRRWIGRRRKQRVHGRSSVWLTGTSEPGSAFRPVQWARKPKNRAAANRPLMRGLMAGTPRRAEGALSPVKTLQQAPCGPHPLVPCRTATQPSWRSSPSRPGLALTSRRPEISWHFFKSHDALSEAADRFFCDHCAASRCT